jgi:glycosyltransferase involved in cell wall biosynthesis
MARHAIDILRDPDRAREMGRVARRHAVERFHIAKVVPMYEAVYERVLDRDPVGMSGWAPDI